ncbi:MAG: choice-of-anchor D domain-containing protein [Bacteroidetes bacterium]|nr:choice-of-anchor D domain-containing protein [Bacteroidota bacterium]
MHLLRPSTLIAPLLLALALLARADLHAQYNLGLLSIDARNFPAMSATFVLLDPRGNPVRTLDAKDFQAFENDQQVASLGFSVDCPPPGPASPIHAVLVMDRSGSMSLPTPAGPNRFSVMKNGASAFAQAVQYVGSTAIAATAFDDLPSIVSDFTNSPLTLTGAINAITLGNGTEYMPAFIDSALGGIPLLAAHPNAGEKRILVFVTDGLPHYRPAVDTIVAKANRANIAIYAITIGLPMNADLAAIAARTGGETYSDVEDPNQMQAVYTSIALHAQGFEPCTVRWISQPGCGPASALRTFRLVYTPKNVASTLPFVVPDAGIIKLAVSPELVWFGPIAPPDSAQRSVTITGQGAPIPIDSASVGGNTRYRIVDWGGPPPPFVLAPGESRTLQLRFKPTDSLINTASLAFASSLCTFDPTTLSGGVRRAVSVSRIQLLNPIGGERFGGCDSIMIRWSGVTPLDTVLIEYRTSDTSAWQTITRTGTGLQYAWSPPAPGTGYRIRVTGNIKPLPDSIVTVAGGGALDTNDIGATQVALFAPSAVVSDGDLLYIVESAGHRIRRVNMQSGIITTIAGTGAPGNSGDGGPANIALLTNPSGIALDGQMLYIADYGNHRVRRVDMSTGLINTVAGTGASGFSGDDGLGTRAELSFPSALAVGNGGLFICDQGNNRVRFFDFKTNIITTVAGGGIFVGGDGSPASNVILNKPSAVVYASDPAHFNDTLFIAEEGAHRVRIVEMRSRIISTIAGTSFQGYDGEGKDGRDSKMNGPRGVELIGNMFYMSDAGNSRVRMVPRGGGAIATEAGNGTAGYGGDNGPAAAARLNMPSGLSGAPGKLFIADLANDRVREVLLHDFGRSDSSHSNFTIASGKVAYAIKSRTVVFGARSVGSAHDSAIASAICNMGDVPFLIDSIELADANPEDFSLVSGLPGTAIPPGACIPIEIRFEPQGTGARNAIAIVHSRCAGTDTLTLRGTGNEPCGSVVVPRMDAGSVLVSTSTQVTIVKAIANNGATTLSGTIGVSPADGDFSIVSGGGPFSLAPGSSMDVSVKFAPTLSGIRSALLTYGLAETCGSVSTLLVGRGVVPQTLGRVLRTDFPDLPCGDWPRDTTLTISNIGDAPLDITGIALANGSNGYAILSAVPSPSTPLSIPPAASASVRIGFNPPAPGIFTDTLRITSNDPAGPASVPLSGRRDLLSLTGSRNILAYNGTIATGYPFDSTVVIHNNGTRPLTINSAVLEGVNADRFGLTNPTLPAVVNPGDSIVLRIDALGPAGGSGYSAAVRLLFGPSCDSGAFVLPVIETGAEPAVLAMDQSFGTLRCPGDGVRDTVVTISNPGGAQLLITALTLVPAGGPFTVLDAPPLVVPSSGRLNVRVRFAPTGPGSYSADLRITSSASSGDSVATLSGRRDALAMSAVPASIALGPFIAPGAASGTATLHNLGTATLDLTLSTATTNFIVQGGPAISIPPGDSVTVTVRFSGAAPGTYVDSLVVRETACGIETHVGLKGAVEPGARSTISLPTMAAGSNQHLVLPLHIVIPDRALFSGTGARLFHTTITFNGLALQPDSVTGATLTTNTYDPVSHIQTMTLDGAYPGTGDTLALIHGTVPVGVTVTTPLAFEDFTWDRPAVAVELVNGLLQVTASCTTGDRLTAHVHLTKIRPMPAGDEATVEFDLEEDETVSLVVSDLLGRNVAALGEKRYTKGHHAATVSLRGVPSGTYTIALITPFGGTAAACIVSR